MNAILTRKNRKKPRYLAIHPEILWAHIVGVAFLVILALVLLAITRGQNVKAVVIVLVISTFAETIIERRLLAAARAEEATFVRWRRSMKRSGQMQHVDCSLILDYEGGGPAMIVGKLKLSHGKSLYFVSPKFRWNGKEDIDVEADVFYMPGEKVVYISAFWPKNISSKG